MSAGPSAATITRRTAIAVALPTSGDRHPRTVPTARTTVKASTHSTSEARKEAVTDVLICAQPTLMLLPNESKLFGAWAVLVG